MSKNLVIVESPAKAKTIEKYLGSDFRVLSSVGHIRSIPKKSSNGKPPVDVANGYKTQYEIDPEKKKVITELKKGVKAASTIWLATDEDREGEAIAWHLCEVLDLDPKKTNRIVFHEITKDAIEEAVKKPRHVDMKLVQAQQARQILDRIVGFELSPVVWQKVPGGKSAGRVQSPAVRLLVEREREIKAFESSFQFKITAVFSHGKDEVKAELPERFDSEKDAEKFLKSLIGTKFKITDISTSPGTRNPSAPFTTSTLQQEANSRLGFSSKGTMSSAQRLYQAGKITYMRTDSVNLSGQAIASAKSFITEKYGEKYSHVRNFKTKSAGAQEAHEAIRPTDMKLEKATTDARDQKLYNLIRNRALASQMAPAQLERTTVTISIGSSKQVFEAKGEVVLFDGFLKVYGTNKKEDDLLPKLESGDDLKLSEAVAKQTFAKPPARYTEGSLVKKLEELGIGRPSTYATIIDTVQTRGYVVKGEGEGVERDIITLILKTKSVDREVIQEKTGADRGKLIPTPAGELIADFLGKHFKQIVDYDFTADVEKKFDKIAESDLKRNDMLDEFYVPFHKLIDSSDKIDRSKVGQSRVVGKHPKTGQPITARFGRYGPMLQLDGEGDEKPRFAPMPKGLDIESVTLKDAMHAFELPRTVGQTPDGDDIKANVGRFGPYIQIGKLFVNIKDEDPRTITLETSMKLYKAKLKAEAEKNVAEFDDGIKVLRGRFGPYVTDGTKNAKIPKETDPTTVTHEQAKKLLAEAPEGKKRFGRRKK